MKKKVCPGRVLFAGMLAAVLAAFAFAAPAVAQDPAPSDGFDLPERPPADRGLALPVPVPDPVWPAPTPEGIAPDDEDNADDQPSEDLDAAPAPARAAPDDAAVAEPEPQRTTPPVVISPDGEMDAASLAPEPAAGPPDALKPDVPEPSDLEEERDPPSPLEEDDAKFNHEFGDPTEK